MTSFNHLDFQIGDQVQCRDNNDWREGTVIETSPKLLVKCDGWPPLSFKEVRLMASKPPRAPERKKRKPNIEINTALERIEETQTKKNANEFPKQIQPVPVATYQVPAAGSRIPVLVSNQLLYGYAQCTGQPFVTTYQLQRQQQMMMMQQLQQQQMYFYYPTSPISMQQQQQQQYPQHPIQSFYNNPTAFYNNFASSENENNSYSSQSDAASSVPSENSSTSSVPAIPVQGIIKDTKFELPSNVQTIISNARSVGL